MLEGQLDREKEDSAGLNSGPQSKARTMVEIIPGVKTGGREASRRIKGMKMSSMHQYSSVPVFNIKGEIIWDRALEVLGITVG